MCVRVCMCVCVLTSAAPNCLERLPLLSIGVEWLLFFINVLGSRGENSRTFTEVNSHPRGTLLIIGGYKEVCVCVCDMYMCMCVGNYM